MYIVHSTSSPHAYTYIHAYTVYYTLLQLGADQTWHNIRACNALHTYIHEYIHAHTHTHTHTHTHLQQGADRAEKRHEAIITRLLR